MATEYRYSLARRRGVDAASLQMVLALISGEGGDMGRAVITGRRSWITGRLTQIVIQSPGWRGGSLIPPPDAETVFAEGGARVTTWRS